MVKDISPETRRVFGEVLRAYRIKRNLTQDALARAAGVDDSLVSFYERSKKLPTLATVLLLARALGVKPGKLVDKCAEAIFGVD
jgi:transcriptional regulator with XRE-family HTH domain